MIVSWWGPGSTEAARLPARDAGRARGRAAGRAARRAVRRSDACVARARSCGPSRSDGVTDFYIYDSTTSPDSEWKAAQRRSWRDCGSSPTRACPGRPRRVASPGSTPTTCASTTASRSRACARRRACTACSALRRSALATTPNARPATLRVHDRDNGKTYDRMWRGAIRAAADVVTITSYNEWHEGTQIEPASAIGAPVRVVRRRLRSQGSRRRARVPRPHGRRGCATTARRSAAERPRPALRR